MKGIIMENQNKVILVTGATGTQGSAVVRSLTKRGWKVRGLTRNPDTEKADLLRQMHVEVVRGDLSDPKSVRKYLDDVYGVFSVQNFWEHGFDIEVKQGKDLADIAKDAAVNHFVYSSVGSAHRNTHLSHFESKWEIEEYIRASGIPYTIFRPVFYMDNFLAMKDQILEGKLILGVEPNVPFQMIASKDIGEFVEAAFAEPDVYLGKSIDIAGDEKTLPEIAEIFSKETGRTVSYIKLDMDDFEKKMGHEYARMVEWFNNVGYDVNIDQLKDTYDVELTSFREWIRQSEFAKAKIKS